MTGHKHCPALRREIAQEVPQPPHPVGIKPVGGLVEDEKLRIAKQCGRETQALAHTKRIARGAASARSVQVDERQHFFHPAARDASDMGQHPQMIAARAPWVQVSGLEHRSDASRRPLELNKPAAKDERATTRGSGQPEQHPQRRCLARTVRTQEAGDAACLQPERQIAHGLEGAKALGQPDCGNHWCHTA